VSASHVVADFRSLSTSDGKTTKNALHFPLIMVKDVLIEDHTMKPDFFASCAPKECTS